MLIPKKKYRSTKHLPVIKNRKIIHSLQLECYKGYFPMMCNNKCPLHSSCWFYGLKNYKGVIL